MPRPNPLRFVGRKKPNRLRPGQHRLNLLRSIVEFLNVLFEWCLGLMLILLSTKLMSTKKWHTLLQTQFKELIVFIH